MKLNIIDRLRILNILPPKGDFKTVCAKDDIIEKIKVSQKEFEKIDWDAKRANYLQKKLQLSRDVEFTDFELEFLKKSLENMISFNVNKAKKFEKEFKFTDFEVEIIADSLEKLEETKSLISDDKNIYKLFVK